MTSIRVRVVFVAGDAPEEETLVLEEGTTFQEAIAKSVLHRRVDPANHFKIGIFGRLCLPTQIMADGDRIEIYRPLTIDPKDARRARADTRARRAR